MREIQEITLELNITQFHYDMILVVTGLIAAKIIVEGLENVNAEEIDKIRLFKYLQIKLRRLNEEIEQFNSFNPFF